MRANRTAPVDLFAIQHDMLSHVGLKCLTLRHPVSAERRIDGQRMA